MLRGVRFGYSFWGFLGDRKLSESGQPLSTPDGNATYSWSVLREAQSRGWETHQLMPDRDRPGFERLGPGLFSSFSQDGRCQAYRETHKMEERSCLPELDVVLLEWRFPVPGRNFAVSKLEDYQPDLDIQARLLEHYKSRGTRVILWDLDHKLTAEDETRWDPAAVFETSVAPRELTKKRVRVEPPTFVSELLQHPMLSPDAKRRLVYVGSRYERDDVITQYLRPASDRRPGTVEFWGNWLKTVDECRLLWPNVSFNDRVTVADFRRVYGTAVACPLLAKRSYFKTGFVTPRVWEALLFGTVPVGFDEHLGIGQYLPDDLLAQDSRDLDQATDYLLDLGNPKRRASLRERLVERLEFMDVRHFIDKVERVLESGAGPAQSAAGGAGRGD